MQHSNAHNLKIGALYALASLNCVCVILSISNEKDPIALIVFCRQHFNNHFVISGKKKRRKSKAATGSNSTKTSVSATEPSIG